MRKNYHIEIQCISRHTFEIVGQTLRVWRMWFGQDSFYKEGNEHAKDVSSARFISRMKTGIAMPVYVVG